MTTLVSVASGDMGRVWDLARRTWEPYCQRHGYILKTIRKLPLPDLHPSWNKVKVTLDEIRCAPGPVWCVDSDMTMARPDVPLETPNLSSKPVWFSSDWNGLCAGMFRVAPGLWQEWFLSLALFCGDVRNSDQFGKGLGCKWEQNAFKVLIREFPAISDRVGLLPPNLVCDQPPGNHQAVVYHFGGRSNNERIRMMCAIHHLTAPFQKPEPLPDPSAS